MHGIYFQGFHRYSVDQKWHVPHFEKMLYDQAQLAAVCAQVYQITKNDRYKALVDDILLYVNRDLSHPVCLCFFWLTAVSFPIGLAHVYVRTSCGVYYCAVKTYGGVC